MTITTAPSRVEANDVVAVRVPTLGWALRRTLLAIFILTVSVAGAACLLYASIDPEEDEAQPAALSHTHTQQLPGHSALALNLPRHA
jgi:hypothetical protein